MELSTRRLVRVIFTIIFIEFSTCTLHVNVDLTVGYGSERKLTK